MIYHSIDSRLKQKKIDDLLDLPVILTVNAFTEASAKEFRVEFNKAANSGQPIIPIVLDTYGGQCYSLLNMISVIKDAPVPVATIAVGKAISCGALLFAMGSEGHRYMSPHATLMLHQVSGGAFGGVEHCKSDIKEMDRINDYLFRMIATNVGKPENYFLDLIHTTHKNVDWYLTPEEAKKHNLANFIRVPSFRIKVESSVTFG